MDLFEKRAGKWVVVRSAAARVDLADSLKAQSQDPMVVESIKLFEQEIGDAMVAAISRNLVRPTPTIGRQSCRRARFSLSRAF